MISKHLYDYQKTDLVHFIVLTHFLLFCDMCVLMVDLSYDVLANIRAPRPAHDMRS